MALGFNVEKIKEFIDSQNMKDGGIRKIIFQMIEGDGLKKEEKIVVLRYLIENRPLVAKDVQSRIEATQEVLMSFPW